MTELPLSLSIVTAEKMTVTMLERGTALPASKTRIFTTRSPLPNAVMIELVKGERFAAADNSRITRIRIGGIKKTVGDVARIAVKVEALEDGSIVIEAFDYGSHHKKKKIIDSSWIPSDEEIEATLEEAKKHYEEETILRDRSRLISRAKAMTLTVKSVSPSERSNISEEDWNTVMEKAKDLRQRTKKITAKDLSDIEAKVITEQITGIQKVLKDL